MDKLNEIWGNIYSATRALLRLLFLTIAMFASGVHLVLFTRTEVCNVEMRGMPWVTDRDTGHADNEQDGLCLHQLL